MIKMSFSYKISNFVLILVVRLTSLFIVKTSFVPDEYWQSLEVAHQKVFGYGYLTWEWRNGIRSSIYPAFISSIYQFLKHFNLDSIYYLTQIPRLVQALTVAFSDVCIYNLSHQLFGKATAQWTLFCSLTNWFLFYCTPRTIINTTEMSLTAIALSKYPWKLKRKSTFYLWIVSLNYALRPTAAIYWLPLFIFHFVQTQFKFHLIKKTVLIGFTVLIFTSLLDLWFYNRLVFTPFNFFWFNWVENVGNFYGSHPFHWYLTQGLPVTFGIHLIPFCLGLKLKKLWVMYGVTFWSIIVLSLVGHKEFRFLLPIMPLAMCLSGQGLTRLSSRYKTVLAILIVALNIPLSFYFGLIHQRGTLDVMEYLRQDAEVDKTSILFLLPCHSTPYYSHIHLNITMRFLTCEYNFKNSPGYVPESDAFFGDPQKWLRNEIFDEKLLTRVVIFDKLHHRIKTFLRRYRECYRTFHSHFQEGETGKYISVYCLN